MEENLIKLKKIRIKNYIFIISSILLFILIIIMCYVNFVLYINLMEPVPNVGPSSAKIQAIEIFNSRFNAYQGDSVEGKDIKILIELVYNSNHNNNEHNVKINGQDANIHKRNNIDLDSIYCVEFEYDLEGYVNNIIIKKLKGVYNGNS